MALTLLAQQHPLASSAAQRDHLARTTACPPFDTRLAHAGLAPLHATGITVFQITGYNGFCGSCSTPFIEPEASKFSSQLSA